MGKLSTGLNRIINQNNGGVKHRYFIMRSYLKGLLFLVLSDYVKIRYHVPHIGYLINCKSTVIK